MYCKFRNIVQREVISSKSSYFSDQIAENRNNPKSLWQQLKQLGYKSFKSGNDGSDIPLENISIEFVKKWIDHSYELVWQKLPKKIKQ